MMRARRTSDRTRRGRFARLGALAAACTVFLLPPHARPAAALELSSAQVSRLDNGLTLIVLEDHTLPVVSVQALYRVGARYEEVGRTGMAHFLEHMAFRATENFPDTDVVSSIYAAGGEWHGYTWIDQTTYFETLPADRLDLALRIEADRLCRLLIPGDQVEAERGAVLAEMHGYDNDPATRLQDAVLMVSFLQHPYRNNTIGWESDVAAIQHQDIVDFYRRHYRPPNLVLAVVGDVDRDAVRKQVLTLFGDFPDGERSLPPPTEEPTQAGIRRVELKGRTPRHLFKIAYRAPAVRDRDFPAFLLLRELLGGGAGLNFAQNEWGTPVRPGSRLAGITGDLVTWSPPSDDPYVLVIGGTIARGGSRDEIEARVESAVAALRDRPPGADELRAAREHLLRELVFDVETTEDAAHQLAFFEGLDALDVLLDIPRLTAAVTPEQVRQVAGTWLHPDRRTVGWFISGDPPTPTARNGEIGEIAGPAHPTTSAVRPEARRVPVVLRLDSGLPVIFQRMALSRSAFLRVVVPTTGMDLGDSGVPDVPIWRHTSINVRFLPEELRSALAAARSALDASEPKEAPAMATVTDPERRLALELDDVLGIEPLPGTRGVAALVVVGDLDAEDVRSAAADAFGDVPPGAAELAPIELSERLRVVDLGVDMAQTRIGYVVPAPPPTSPDFWAWRALLYIISHGYEGRLGTEAISRRGLVYYIDGQYLTDGINGRVSLSIGVDPGKLEAMRALLEETLEGLRRHPPTEAELDEARSHFVGRRISAAQSNQEVSGRLAEEWVTLGRLPTDEEFNARLSRLDLGDLERVIPAFVSGAVVVVR